MKRTILILSLMFFCASAYSQVSVIAGWQTAVGMSGAHNSTTNHANLETAVLRTATGSYYEVTIKAKSGYYVSLISLDAKMRRALATSVNQYRWSYSLNGIDFTEVGPGDVTMTDNAVLNTSK